MKINPLKVSNPKKQAEPALNQRQIVQAALGLLDEVGFDGLTMRSLANKLGVKAASLYWHVRNKQELLSLDSVADILEEELAILEDEVFALTLMTRAAPAPGFIGGTLFSLN